MKPKTTNKDEKPMNAEEIKVSERIELLVNIWCDNKADVEKGVFRDDLIELLNLSKARAEYSEQGVEEKPLTFEQSKELYFHKREFSGAKCSEFAERTIAEMDFKAGYDHATNNQIKSPTSVKGTESVGVSDERITNIFQLTVDAVYSLDPTGNDLAIKVLRDRLHKSINQVIKLLSKGTSQLK